MKTSMFNHITAGLGLFLTLTVLLSGCAMLESPKMGAPAQSSATSPKRSVLDDLPVDSQSVIQATTNILDLVQAAKNASSPQQEALLLKAAHLALNQDKIDYARKIRSLIDIDQLTDEMDLDYFYQLVSLQLALAEQDQTKIEQHLTELDQISDQRKISMATTSYFTDSQLRAQALAALDQPLNAAQLLVARISPLKGDTTDRQLWHDQIWQYMQSAMRQKQLAQEQAAAGEKPNKKTSLITITEVPSDEWQAWLELSNIFERVTQSQLSLLQTQIQQWQQQFAQSQVAKAPPTSVSQLIAADFEPIRQVAVLLPETGELQYAGKAIREGLMTAYYQEQQELQADLKLVFYDTENQDVQTLYQRALDDGAQFVIGPLVKEQVASLKQTTDLSAPVLALNYTNDEQPTGASERFARGFYEFGLSAEDEARQAAEYAVQQGYSRALVLRPDNAWGERVSQAFNIAWTKQGGKVLDETAFTDPQNFSTEVEHLLGIDKSKRRHQRMEAQTGEEIDFTPRRRQDAQFLFLVASPDEGRQLKPTINYHYGRDLPVIATSHIYSGQEQRADKDLNHVIFADIPWVLTAPSELKQRLSKDLPKSQARFQRLHALGVDAFKLMREFPLLGHTNQADLEGVTGRLDIQPSGKVERSVLFAQFKGGKAQLLDYKRPEPKSENAQQTLTTP